MKTLVYALTLITLAACGGSGDATDTPHATDSVSSGVADELHTHEAPAYPSPKPIRIQPSVKRSSLKLAPCGIVEATYTDSVIEMNVEFGGGCETHIFELIAHNLQFSQESNQVDCILTHNANDDSCEAMVSQQMRFGVGPIISAYQNSPAAGSGKPIILNIFGPHAKKPKSTFSIAVK